ncbi:response regulator [Ramlibacter sp. G-1-2-2]|uniref:histidine kinase n=1 Tax=Ramlibacter agri TaxID=2728837 RepID=A0A848H442_9BURK|nr:ATP-binding protein [Ramlibacter agri]NML42528.1 response regulator [Ramlibacter agri]
MLDVVRRILGRDRRGLEKRLQLALAAGKMAAWEWDLRSPRRWWSPEMFPLHGLPPASELPADYYALVHPDDRQRFREAMHGPVRTCGEHSVQYRVVWANGSVHWLEGTGTTVCDDEGQPELMTGVCLNIDARKEEEANLQFLAEASAELAALTDYPATMQRIARLAVPHFADWCAVDMLDDQGKLQRVAVAHVDEAKVSQVQELFDRFPPGPDAPGGTWTVVQSGHAELVPVITPAMLEAGVGDPEYLQALLALGLHSYIGVPLRAQGTMLGAISFITSESRRVFTERDLLHAIDLAARASVAITNARLLDALRSADAQKDLFLATLGHELRNPLAPIVNSVEMLARARDPQRLLPRAVHVMQRQARHLVRLVDDLLDLARINSGKIELRREVLDLRDVLRAAVESCQPLIDRRRHVLSIELPGEPARVDGDPVRLAQVFANLLNNAAKYTHEGGRIELRLRVADAAIEVSVSDDGVGIPPELLPQMFDLFTQAGTAPHLEQHGLGIGLFLVKGLVQMHEGHIQAQSGGPGQGSSFVVSLPRAAAVESMPAPATPSEEPRASRRVLVVDDNVDAADTLSQLLEVLGHTPTTANDGASALARFDAAQPEVVLLDIGLPDMDGYEVARSIRQRVGGDSVRLVALTGWGQAEDKRRAVEAGFDEHWTKPVDVGRLGGI